jgi:hypothetical protein
MARRGSSFGLIVLVVTLAVVLLLVARSWKSVAPTATQIPDRDGAALIDDHGETAAAGAIGSGSLPDLNEMRRQTDLHSRQVQDVLARTDEPAAEE